MFQQMKKRIKNEKGLTLIELLAVIVILAIIAAIAIPAIGNIINNQRDKAILSDISGLVASAKIAYADGSCGTDEECTLADLDYTSTKISAGTVNFTANTTTGANSSNPTISGIALANGVAFKGKHKEEFDKLIEPQADFVETELNEYMEGKVTATTP